MKLNLDLIRERNGFYLTPAQLKEDLIIITDVIKDSSSELNQLVTRINTLSIQSKTDSENFSIVTSDIYNTINKTAETIQILRKDIAEKFDNRFLEYNIYLSNMDTRQDDLTKEIAFLKNLWFVKVSIWFNQFFQRITGKLKKRI